MLFKCIGLYILIISSDSLKFEGAQTYSKGSLSSPVDTAAIITLPYMYIVSNSGTNYIIHID